MNSPTSSAISPTDPPQSDVIEVSLFGPGFGESILVHLGWGDWILVDSCVDKAGRSPPMDYLSGIGVKPDSVKAIIATHWHDDHVKGISDVFQACTEAEFFCAAAIGAEEFLKFLAAYSSPRTTTKLGSGTDEFSAVLEIIRRRKSGRALTKVVELVGANQRLFQRMADTAQGIEASEVWALSPSSGSHALTLAQIGGLLPQANQQKKRAPSPKPNNLAIALHIAVGSNSILLGSDLEKTSDPRTGWEAVISSAKRPTQRAGLYKVAHHGSHTAHEARIWSVLLEPSPLALLTPFVNGAHRIPTNSEAKPIIALSPRSFITAHPSNKKAGSGAILSIMGQTATSIRDASPEVGHIRARKSASAGSNWDVSLHRGARSLEQVLRDSPS